MARASRFTGAVSGEKEAIAAFKRLPEVAREHFGEATRKSAFSLLSRAKAQVRVRTGKLKQSLNWSYNEKTGIGRVGIEKGAGTGSYGHLVEFGHGGPRPAPAYPFMIPAAEAERSEFLSGCRAAGKQIERDMGTVGGGLV